MTYSPCPVVDFAVSCNEASFRTGSTYFDSDVDSLLDSDLDSDVDGIESLLSLEEAVKQAFATVGVPSAGKDAIANFFDLVDLEFERALISAFIERASSIATGQDSDTEPQDEESPEDQANDPSFWGVESLAELGAPPPRKSTTTSISPVSSCGSSGYSSYGAVDPEVGLGLGIDLDGRAVHGLQNKLFQIQSTAASGGPLGEQFGPAFSNLESLLPREDPSVIYKSIGYPIRPGEQDCPFFITNGWCGYGSNCKFNHPEKQVFALGQKSDIQFGSRRCEMKHLA
jgi:hypothetical protein